METDKVDVLKALEKLASIAEPDETCGDCRSCADFNECIIATRNAISDLSEILIRIIEHLNILFNTIAQGIKGIGDNADYFT